MWGAILSILSFTLTVCLVQQMLLLGTDDFVILPTDSRTEKKEPF